MSKSKTPKKHKKNSEEKELKKFAKKVNVDNLRIKLLNDFKSIINQDDIEDNINELESDSFFNNL